MKSRMNHVVLSTIVGAFVHFLKVTKSSNYLAVFFSAGECDTV